MSKFVAAVVVLLATTIFASRQLFLFTVFSDPAAVQGNRDHLWLAVSAAVAACMAGALMFHFFLSHERNKSSKGAAASIGPSIQLATTTFPISTAPLRSHPIGREPANLWLAEGQADDRSPMNGSVAQSARPASGQRAFARSSHQLMFKKWSQGRHD
jgi:hypothetical protein